MARHLRVAAAQLGPIHLADSRESVVLRLIDLLGKAHGSGCGFVVFPELALTTFFPRYYMDNQEDIDAYFEKEMPGPETAPLFEEAKRLSIGFHLGYAELDGEHHFNTAILVDTKGSIVGKYRKSIFRDTPLTGHTHPSSIWRSATSRSAISAFPSGVPSTASSACASATTGAGRRRSV